MPIEIAARLSGLFFWLIIITNVASNQFGYLTMGDMDAEADLEKINTDPKKFKTGFALILIEHICIILLAVMLFIAFNQYSVLLAIIWLVVRSVEGIIQIINKRNYWRLFSIAQQYAGASETEQQALNASRLDILQSKHANFTVAQILFAIGTLAYAVLFVTYSVVPAVIAGFGIAASLIYGLGNGILLVKSDFKIPAYLGGLLILIFETILGGWLLFA